MNSYTTSALLFVLLVVVAAASPRGDRYTNKYDNIDLDEILGNDRLLKNYVNCLLNKGKCTPDGKELKMHVSDAIQNDCEKCTEKQKEGGERVIRYLHDNKPEMFDALTNKYDPTGEYKAKYEEKFGS